MSTDTGPVHYNAEYNPMTEREWFLGHNLRKMLKRALWGRVPNPGDWKEGRAYTVLRRRLRPWSTDCWRELMPHNKEFERFAQTVEAGTDTEDGLPLVAMIANLNAIIANLLMEEKQPPYDRKERAPAWASRLRCALGNPFHTIQFCGDLRPGCMCERPAWLTDEVQEFAAQARREGCQADALRLLADLMKEAGCPETVLCHAAELKDHLLHPGGGCAWCGGRGKTDCRLEANPLLAHLVAEVKEYKDGALHFWYNTADPGMCHLTPDRAAAYEHSRTCHVLDILLGEA